MSLKWDCATEEQSDEMVWTYVKNGYGKDGLMTVLNRNIRMERPENKVER